MTQEEIALIVGSVGNLSAEESALLLTVGNEAKTMRFSEINLRINDSVIVQGHVVRFLDREVLKKLSKPKAPKG